MFPTQWIKSAVNTSQIQSLTLTQIQQSVEEVRGIIDNIDHRLSELRLISYDYTDVHDCECVLDVEIFLESILRIAPYVSFRFTLGNFKVSELISSTDE